MRAMLDELMGKERDLPPEERTGRGISYKDPQICKYALVGLCPYGLFKNTKSDLGRPQLQSIELRCLNDYVAYQSCVECTYRLLNCTLSLLQVCANTKYTRTTSNLGLRKKSGMLFPTTTKKGATTAPLLFARPPLQVAKGELVYCSRKVPA